MSTDSWINALTHLEGRPRADEALLMLKKISSLVRPIMRSHKWMLPILAEFFPNQTNLLGMNVNMGRKILLRLRPAHDPDTFLEVEEVVQTMLHELTHNVHGPHDDRFYKLLSVLQDEYEKLVRSGYAGEGFYTKGNRLGASVSHNVSPHLARARALEAAEKRKRLGEVMGDGGGRRLGGTLPAWSGQSPQELAVMAAERRLLDEKICGQGVCAEEEAAKATENSIIDLTGDSDDEDDEVLILETSSRAGSSFKDITPSKAPRPGMQPKVKATGAVSSSVQSAKLNPGSTSRRAHTTSNGWTCNTCTLVNKQTALQCNACLSNRPHGSSGWTCLICGEGPISLIVCTCTFCGTTKTSS